MKAFYNEIDTYCCDWLSNLMDAGHITAGVISDKSIEDIFPDELIGFDRCHFFAGIGVWDYALNIAGWGDRPVWTGSAPCQPFSAAGKGLGFDDERHLWPAWAWLIGECRPPVIFGEQVASKDVEPWIDLVQADVEAMGYSLGCVPFPSAGVGAPHIRDRSYFVAHAAQRGRRKERAHARGFASGDRAERFAAGLVDGGMPVRMADADSLARRLSEHEQRDRIEVARRGEACELADADSLRGRWDARAVHRAQAEVDRQRFEDGREPDGSRLGRAAGDAGPTNGFWRDADWLLCRDEKWRPVEPGTFPLADGAPSRVGRLRAYGNAINAEAARTFIEAARDVIDQPATS